MRKLLRWVTQFSASMLLFWWVTAAVVMGSCAFGMAYEAFAFDAPEIYKVLAGNPKIYVNHPDPDGGHEDNLVVEDVREWALFNVVSNNVAVLKWGYVDYQRFLIGTRIDVQAHTGEWVSWCTLTEVEPDTFKHVKDISPMDNVKFIGNLMCTCEGVEEWFKKELEEDN